MLANDPVMPLALKTCNEFPSASGEPLTFCRLSVPPSAMLPVVEVTASLTPLPLSLITAVPFNAMLPVAEIVPVAF